MHTSSTPAALATVYTKLGQTLRVALGHPRVTTVQQLTRWFTQQQAANPGFPVRVRSILLQLPEPLCASCQVRLLQFLNQYGLAGRLRMRVVPRRTAPTNCGCAVRDWATSPRSQPFTQLDMLLEEVERHDSEPDDLTVPSSRRFQPWLSAKTARWGDAATNALDTVQAGLQTAGYVLGQTLSTMQTIPDTSRDAQERARDQGQQVATANQAQQRVPVQRPPRRPPQGTWQTPPRSTWQQPASALPARPLPPVRTKPIPPIRLKTKWVP